MPLLKSINHLARILSPPLQKLRLTMISTMKGIISGVYSLNHPLIN